MKRVARTAFESFADSIMPERGPVLLVADSGGHLQELVSLDRLIHASVRRVWISSDTDMSRSILKSQQDVRLHKTRIFPRRIDVALRSVPFVVNALRALRPQMVISTGPAIAVPWLSVATCMGIGAVFIESATFVTRHSLSGRLLQFTPGIQRFSQTGLCTRGWGDAPNVFDLVEPLQRRVRDPSGPPHLFVTVGSNRYPFDRLVRRLDALVPASWQITWQLSGGRGAHRPRRGRIEELLPFEETQRLLKICDVVVCHAGVGSAMSALAFGHAPIVVPRSQAYGEHVDDHQHDLAIFLRRFPQIAVRAPQGISTADLLTSAAI